MGGPLNNFDRRFRYIIVAVLSILGAVGIGIATQIGPLTEPDELLPDDHPMVKTGKLISDEFVTTTDQSGAFLVSIVWGVKDLDRSEVGLWDPEVLGELVWDDQFDVSPEENQKSVMKLCEDLRDDHELVKDNEVICWIQDMDIWLR